MTDRRVDGFGQRATLLPSAGARAYGMLYAVTHAELDRLYTAPGLEHYRPEALMRIRWAARRRRPSATTCAKRRGPRSEIRTTRSVCGARSPSSNFRRSTSRPWRERAGGR